MATWYLVCPKCKQKFIHNKVNDRAIEQSFRNSFGLTARPSIAVYELECPKCRVRSTYQQFHLTCGDDESDEFAKVKGA
jgi:hypothetical protein